jgi:O-acetyl-ADP-ribose deacetylase (regulator of RNase III)
MIDVKYGDILDCKDGIICHQVNCMGVMGAGLALQIRCKYPKIYNDYSSMCMQNSTEILLENVQMCVDGDVIVANMFSQSDYDRDKNYTDYDAFDKCVKAIYDYMIENNKDTIYFPYKIGCGIAGGSWDIVYNIIKSYFDASPIKCNIIVFDKCVSLDKVKV